MNDINRATQKILLISNQYMCKGYLLTDTKDNLININLTTGFVSYKMSELSSMN